MAIVTVPTKELTATPAENVSLALSAGKVTLCICLCEGDKVIEQKIHTIPMTGSVVDSTGTEIYASVDSTLGTKISDLVDALYTYVEQAATDDKL